MSKCQISTLLEPEIVILQEKSVQVQKCQKCQILTLLDTFGTRTSHFTREKCTSAKVSTFLDFDTFGHFWNSEILNPNQTTLNR